LVLLKEQAILINKLIKYNYIKNSFSTINEPDTDLPIKPKALSVISKIKCV
jgi:hypothetical protein